MRMRTAGLGLSLLAALATLSTAPALAQGWPSRTVKLILPLGPGAGADIGARLFADRLTKLWGQPIVVENRPGGDSMVAIGAFIGANDDHTFLWGPAAAFTAHPFTHPKLPYDAAEIVPIARVSITLVSLTVPAASPIKTVADIVTEARAAPGKLNWAAVTGLNDFVFRSFVKSLNLDMVRVPYRDPVQALNDLSENRIQVYSSAYAIARPQVEGGKVRVVALTNAEPAKALAGIPTVGQAGYPVLEFDGLVGIYGTRIVSSQIRDRIAADVVAVGNDPEIEQRLTATGQVMAPGKAAEFEASIERQRKSAAATAKVLGIALGQ